MGDVFAHAQNRNYSAAAAKYQNGIYFRNSTRNSIVRICNERALLERLKSGDVVDK